ncbi:MAG: pyrroline-5-carboxylate reductase family protein [Candidatus Sulfotelmatobacter sp.]
MKSTVFLGAGRITSALVAGLRLAEYARPIVVYDRNPKKSRLLRREFHVDVAPDLKSAVEQADMLIVAVRPASVSESLDQVAACRASARPRLWVSLAAGVPLQKLRAQFGPPARWVRAMPSPVCRIGRGLTALCFDRGVGKAERVRVRRLFEHVGSVLEISERQFDAFTTTYSSSHGYHALETLAEAAQRAGLDRHTALTAAAHALSAGILYWKESGQSLTRHLHEAATPGGIAAATMSGMDKSGYARVVANGLKAGIAQARRNARR